MIGAALVHLQSAIDSFMAHWNHSLDVANVANVPNKFGDPRRNTDLAQGRTSVCSASRNTLGAKP